MESPSASRSTLDAMGERALLYYITDRSQFAGDERARRRALLAKIAEAARAEVDFIQLREKDLNAGELEQLALECAGVVERARSENPETSTRFLINSRIDVALAVGADGVHLRADDVSPSDVRLIVKRANKSGQDAGPRGHFLVGVSCHTVSDVIRAGSEGADFAVFAPVFEKRDAPGSTPAGLDALCSACEARIPVFALGGVNLGNAGACLEAGAIGIAGIRLFQENRISDVVRALRTG